MNILHTYSETIVDGDGIRYSIYFAGCPHRCVGCHNPESRNPKAGTLLTDEKLDKIIDEINNNPLLDGITLSGGDPFFNPIEMLPIVKKLKDKTQLSIWCYTGFLYEELLKDKHSQAILEYIDVLVDGPFIQEKYSPTLPFRGSTNQRLIKLRN
ncbi:anaerobic ribonucleoside-triphosphate reductase activating protein [Bacteroides coprosuis DSM 18011]|uniref:Anaerobic ribonucleoside-triphosphate reductase-activating protein n=1 Tax=Bacteroides coprosuis DSM 18011 TaxID=679937 RepID=F3ZNS5_9BACE|nr:MULTISPECIES: anaerobic ribonucleoside-triphosphate reductase activating protein [Bacteroides]EGJ70264.1 anaerobic ribonucleoside-triphosphate reductase activating protein [Bacteroides coprosuis DSM 18011]HJD92001.1 anaerobic ribonucleoside-triphosphate reductase activating protein [Bacteroides coprosuis]